MASSLHPTARTGFTPLAGAAWYKRLHARLLACGSRRYTSAVEDHKRMLFGSLAGRVLEIGPGPGTNLPYFRGDAEWIGVEPNPFMLEYIERAARELGRTVDVRTGSAEYLPFPTASVDAVACSLVLCTVHDVAAALREVRRVLRPGGTFAFIEHVAAPRGTALRVTQRVARPVWRALADGCHPDRETGAAIQDAGFARVEMVHFRAPLPVVGPHVAGLAIR